MQAGPLLGLTLVDQLHHLVAKTSTPDACELQPDMMHVNFSLTCTIITIAELYLEEDTFPAKPLPFLPLVNL